jgi:hypothetical protein
MGTRDFPHGVVKGNPVHHIFLAVCPGIVLPQFLPYWLAVFEILNCGPDVTSEYCMEDCNDMGHWSRVDGRNVVVEGWICDECRG